ncbi:hypothetical protein MFLAVUS_005631 [Mucor flavus]|uniref:Uncharacterized protein n=1 Tax=Mucor flavus TaxID=439312 RepID=A0ABP9YZC4_9FUNG
MQSSLCKPKPCCTSDDSRLLAVYDLHQHTHCVFLHIGKYNITTHFDSKKINALQILSALAYNKDRTNFKVLVRKDEEETEDNIVIDNFRDKLYDLFKKKKEDWDEEDIFLIDAVSNCLSLAVKRNVEIISLEIESFDLFHYAFVVPSEWEEEMRDDILRPIFVQSGLISNKDHEDRLLFFSEIESICYGLTDEISQNHSFKRGQNTIFCRIIPDEVEKTLVRFDLIRTTNTLYSFPNSKYFPKVMKSSSVSVTTEDVKNRIKEFLRTNLYPVVTDDGGIKKLLEGFFKSTLSLNDQDQTIKAIMKQLDTWLPPSLVITSQYNYNHIEIDLQSLLKGTGVGVFEAIQHSDLYCKPRIIPSEDSNISSSVFLNSKPDAIVDLDISLGSTLFTYSLLDENGLFQYIFNHDYFTADNLPPLEHFYTFSNTATLNVKEQFIPFAERYLLGDLSDLTVDDGASIKKDLLLEMKAILSNNLSNGEVLVSTGQPKYIKAFILMYMVYVKGEIMCKLPDQLISDQLNMKIGYAVSIEAMLLNNTMGTKDNFRDLIFASGLVPKDNDSKKLRITTQGERILLAIQKSLKLKFPLKSYFLLCQLHEDYVQLSLHQVVTDLTLEENEQESIIVQDEIVAIPNIYDSLCVNMWHNLVQDRRLIELCEMHNTSDKSEVLDLFSSKTKKEFFTILRVHISDNVLQNNPGAQRNVDTNSVKLNNSCNCKVRLTTADIIDISFTPVLQDIACTLSGSLLNKELFGNYMNIDYLFSFIHFNNNPQLQYAFARILEEEADDFNLELGIDTCCLLVPELFSQLIRPVIAQRPLCYKDFKIGALQQICSENYVAGISQKFKGTDILFKTKITDIKIVEFNRDTVIPFLSKGKIINNGRSNRTFYLENEQQSIFAKLTIGDY